MNTIFLIDDDEDDQLLCKEAIEIIKPSLRYDTATNGKDALEKLKVGRAVPAFILLNLNMPVMNSFDFLMQQKK